MPIGRYQAIVMGASAGGSKALLPILQCLPENFACPVIIAQHLHPLQEGPALMYRAQGCVISLREAEEKEAVRGGLVYFAPPNYHLLIEDDRTFSLSIDVRINYSRPAIDVLFESAADVYGATLIGVVLSGANNDGAAGLNYIKQHGGLTIAQTPETAEVPYMPKAAIQAAQPDQILSPPEIGRLLVKLIG
jgi:two-component system, chemotaxis family, protein-glutamate methylesterase/glutaminase